MGGNFGFIREKVELKILILFIMRRLPGPAAFEDIAGIALCEEGVSYFDFSQCVAELVNTEHLQFEDKKYSMTAKGARNGEITENSLPLSVRNNAEKATAALRSAQLRSDMIKTRHEAKEDGGCTVTLSMSDGVGDIISIELYAANEKQARSMEKRFRNNAESIYGTLVDKLLG